MAEHQLDDLEVARPPRAGTRPRDAGRARAIDLPQPGAIYASTTRHTLELDATLAGGLGVVGLATMTGSSLTIRYTKKGEDNVATEIAVQPKKS
jgi:hypothetical protein